VGNGGTEILYNDFWSFVRFEYYRIFAAASQSHQLGVFFDQPKGRTFFLFSFDKILGVVLVLGFSTACTQKLSYKALIHLVGYTEPINTIFVVFCFFCSLQTILQNQKINF